jgi:ferrochelatase
VFSAHSLPEKALVDDPYVKEINETIQAILERTGPLDWHLAFQSRGGGVGAWLEPDVRKVLYDLSQKGHHRVLMVPVGFVSDHMETLFDLDIEARMQAEALGMQYERAFSLNDSPRFIETLAQIVLEHIDQRENTG